MFGGLPVERTTYICLVNGGIPAEAAGKLRRQFPGRGAGMQRLGTLPLLSAQECCHLVSFDIQSDLIKIANFKMRVPSVQSGIEEDCGWLRLLYFSGLIGTLSFLVTELITRE